MNNLRVKVRRIDGGYEGRVTIGAISVGAEAATPAQALNAATGVANQLLAVVEANPELAALMPPQAKAAIQAIKIASWAAKNGELRKYAKKLPAAAKTVASVLRSIL